MTTMEMTSSKKAVNTRASLAARVWEFISNKSYDIACAAARTSISANAMVRAMNEER